MSSEEQLPLNFEQPRTVVDRTCPVCGLEMRLETRGQGLKVLYCPGDKGWNGCLYGEGDTALAAQDDLLRNAMIKGMF